MTTGLTLAVDIGTGFTTAAIAVNGQAEILRLGPDGPMPTVVALSDDGRLLTGVAAADLAATHPDRAQRNPLQALETTDRVQLGGVSLPAIELIAVVLRQVLHDSARHVAGPAPQQVVLTAPVRWGATEVDKLQMAATRAGLGDVVLIPEPIAAARRHVDPTSLRPGTAVAVYDLGSTTLATTILTATPNGFEIRGEPGGISDFGGDDIDEVLLRRVSERARTLDPGAWDALWADPSPAGQRLRNQLRQQVTTAKEALSTVDSYPIRPGGSVPDVQVTRADLEASIDSDLRATVTELIRTAESAGVRPGELAEIFLAGGSSHMPRVSTLLAEMTGVRPRPVEDPQSTIPLGALLAVNELGTVNAAKDADVTRVLTEPPAPGPYAPDPYAQAQAGPGDTYPRPGTVPPGQQYQAASRNEYAPTARYPFTQPPAGAYGQYPPPSGPSGGFPPPGGYPSSGSYPPPGVGSYATAPMGTAPQPPSTGRRNSLIAAIVVAVVLAVAIPVVVLAATGSDKPGPAPTARRSLSAIPVGPPNAATPTLSATPRTTPPTAASSGDFTTAERRLWAALDATELTDCAANPAGENSTIDASLKCSSSNGLTVVAYHYYSSSSLRSDIDFRASRITTNGTCRTGGTGVETWQFTSDPDTDVGSLLCSRQEQRSVLFWTYDKDLLGFTAADTDAQSLFEWWKGFDPLA